MCIANPQMSVPPQILKQEERIMSQRDALRAAAADFEAEKEEILAEHQEVRNTPLLGPYNRTIPRVMWWS